MYIIKYCKGSATLTADSGEAGKTRWHSLTDFLVLLIAILAFY